MFPFSMHTTCLLHVQSSSAHNSSMMEFRFPDGASCRSCLDSHACFVSGLGRTLLLTQSCCSCCHCCRSRCRREKCQCPACCEEDNQPGTSARDLEDLNDGMLVPENVFPDNAIRREISRLKCYCPNAKSCSWTGQYSNLEEHVTKQCEYTIVNCRLNCGQQVARNALPGHESADCQERLVTCDHCGEKPKAKDKENHMQVCANLPVMCNGCLQKIPRAQLAAHHDHISGTCTRQYVLCPYSCKDQLNKDNLEKHKECCLVIHLDDMHAKVKALKVKKQPLQPLLLQQPLPQQQSQLKWLSSQQQPLLQQQQLQQQQLQQQHGSGIVSSSLDDKGSGTGSGISNINGNGICSSGISSSGVNDIGIPISDVTLSTSSISGNGDSEKQSNSASASHATSDIAVAVAAHSRSTTGHPPCSDGSAFAEPRARQEIGRTFENSATGEQLGASGGVPQGGTSRPEVRSKLTVLTEDVVPNMLKAVEVLSHETKGCAAGVKTLMNYKQRQQEHTQLMEEKVKAIERRIQVKEKRLAELVTHLDMLEHIHYDGILLWQITDFARKRRDAISGKMTELTSHPFFTSPTGYKICARAYLNGDGSAKGTHLSVFFVLMKGPYDAILRWPFIQKVTIILLDQSSSKSHVKNLFQPDPTSQSFNRPAEPVQVNPPFKCLKFFPLNDLENHGYLKDDAIFIKMIIEKT